jgi:hypothetical protein
MRQMILHCALMVIGGVFLFLDVAHAISLGVMGDSLSDEYAEEAYGVYAENWVEQLEIHGGIDLGPTASEAGESGGTWLEPRRTQYQYNWARAGADSNSLLSSGQHTGLAADITAHGIGYAVLAIGANDFHPGGAAYQNIYLGNWTTAQIDSHVDGIFSNLSITLNTVLATGVQLLLVNAPDYGFTPTVRSIFPSVVDRQRVSDVISQLNARIDSLAQARNLPLLDLSGASMAMFGSHQVPRMTLPVGNVSIALDQSDTATGSNPTAGFVHDGIHPNSVLQGIFANLITTGLNVGYGAGFPVFSETELLAHRGIAYGGSDTLVAELGDYSDYVLDYTGTVNPLPLLSWHGALLLALLLSAASVLRLRGFSSVGSLSR